MTVCLLRLTIAKCSGFVLNMRQFGRQLLAAELAVIISAFGVVGYPTVGAVPGRPAGKMVPANGIYFGAFSLDQGGWPGDEAYKKHYTSREATLGRQFDMNHRFYGWNDNFGGGLEQWDAAKGRITLATWQPATKAGPKIGAIINGSEDGRIVRQANLLKRFGKPIFLRFGHEMNLTSSPWNAKFTSDPGTHNGAAKFAQAWRHVHDIFAAQGATNVVWVWEPGASDIPDESWNHWTNYYPGDSYVDWVGIDGYNWGTARNYGGWISFKKRFEGGVYAQYSGRKPIIICETASAEVGGSKPQWIREMRASLKTDFPAVGALVWFDENKETDWRFNSSDGTLAAFRDMANDPYFRPNGSSSVTLPTPVRAQQVDLVVLDVKASSDRPAPGEALTFSATIKNQGNLAIPPGVLQSVAFMINGQKVSWSDTYAAGLAPGAHVRLTANAGQAGSAKWSGGMGTYKLEAQVDDAQRISEANETNNLAATELIIAPGTGWTGKYYNDTHFYDFKTFRHDPVIDFKWPATPLAPGLASTHTSALWQGELYTPTSGVYTFTTYADDGVRLWVDGHRVISDWSNHPPKARRGRIHLPGGRKHSVTLEYYQNVSGATARLSWSGPGIASAVIPAANVYPPKPQLPHLLQNRFFRFVVGLLLRSN